MKAKLVQNIVPAQYKTIGEPITVAAKIPRSREEVRATLTQKDGEECPRVLIAAYEIDKDGEASRKQGGFRFTSVEAAALRDALDQLLAFLNSSTR